LDCTIFSINFLQIYTYWLLFIIIIIISHLFILNYILIDSLIIIEMFYNI